MMPAILACGRDEHLAVLACHFPFPCSTAATSLVTTGPEGMVERVNGPCLGPACSAVSLSSGWPD